MNTWLAERVTKVVGTMWCAYVFCALAFVALPAALHAHSVTVLINWVSSNFLQLVLLPLLMVGQQILNDKHDALHDKIDSIGANGGS